MKFLQFIKLNTRSFTTVYSHSKRNERRERSGDTSKGEVRSERTAWGECMKYSSTIGGNTSCPARTGAKIWGLYI